MKKSKTSSCTHCARNLIVLSVVNALRNVALVYCAHLISSHSNVPTLVLQNRCEHVATDNSGSWSLSKECLRIFSGAILPHIQFSKAVESKVSDIKALHLKDFRCASWRTKQLFFSRWRKNKKIRIFVVVSEVVGSSSGRERASMLLIVEQTHNPLDVTPLLIVGQ